MASGGPEQVPGLLMMTMGGAEQPTSHLDVRFPMFLAHASILIYVFQSFWAFGRSRLMPVQPNRPRPRKDQPPLGCILGGLGLMAGTFKEGYRHLILGGLGLMAGTFKEAYSHLYC